MGVVLLAAPSRGSLCSKSCSALTLLVARVGADHHDSTVTAGHLALLADLLDAGLNLHRFSFSRPVSLPRESGANDRRSLLVAVNDSSTREIVRRQLHDDSVLGQDSDVVLPHLP